MNLKEEWKAYRKHLGATMGMSQYLRARGAAVVILACLVLTMVAGCELRANPVDKTPTGPVGSIRAYYKVAGTSVTEFTLTDGTPCIIHTSDRHVTMCGWGLKWKAAE